MTASFDRRLPARTGFPEDLPGAFYSVPIRKKLAIVRFIPINYGVQRILTVNATSRIARAMAPFAPSIASHPGLP